MIKGKQNVRCGLIGEHLSHSFSPKIHAMLADYSYELLEMPESRVGEFLKSGNFDALNVTIPYKKTVMPYLDEISDEAMRIGSVNTVTRTASGALRGDNTDYYGFSYTVEQSGIDLCGKNVLILGTGGASLTARTVAHDMGADSVSFVSRTGEINYSNVYSECADAQVVINCTPVGMFPNNGFSPIELDRLPLCEGVIDMIYNPARTELLLDAQRLGIKHKNGLSMLVAQAKRACELFLSEKLDDSVIEEIVSKIERDTSNIVLVGMPGCGKTTVARLIAAATGRNIIDTDELIKAATGRSPSEIITEQGEAEFRRIESEQIRIAGKQSGSVISTGGGAVTRDENLAPLKQNGQIFFIRREISSLDKSDRPLSALTRLEDMYKKRLPLYEKFADASVSNDGSPESCADGILDIFNGKKG